MQSIDEIAESNPRQAQIPAIDSRYIWGSGVFNMPLPMDK